MALQLFLIHDNEIRTVDFIFRLVLSYLFSSSGSDTYVFWLRIYVIEPKIQSSVAYSRHDMEKSCCHKLNFLLVFFRLYNQNDSTSNSLDIVAILNNNTFIVILLINFHFNWKPKSLSFTQQFYQRIFACVGDPVNDVKY